MIALSALLPCATIVLAILILRQTAVRAASAGASVAVLLWALGHFSSPNFSQIECVVRYIDPTNYDRGDHASRAFLCGILRTDWGARCNGGNY